jgi:hypothetical protein
MENPTPFDLNEAIRLWQQNLGAPPSFCADDLEELASHLRASVQKLKTTGLSEEEAFQTAVRRIGERGQLEREFAKINPAVTWSLPLFSFWLAAGAYLFQVVYWLIVCILTWCARSGWRDDARLVYEAARVGLISRAEAARIGPPFHAFGVPPFLHQPDPRALSIELILVIILIVRLAVGSWKVVGAFIRSFERPIRAALGLVMLGFVVILSPAVLTNYQMGWGFRLAQSTYWPMVTSNEIGQAAVNAVLVCIMVLLARPALRKISPSDHGKAEG